MKCCFFSVLILWLAGCMHKEKDVWAISLEDVHVFDSIPSGSGLAYRDGCLLIVTDDAPFIYHLSPYDYSYNSIPLKGYAAGNYRIPKPIKPDFESALTGKINDEDFLMAFGSGSMSPMRDSLLLVNLNDLSSQKIISLSSLYKYIQQQTKTETKDWNIEGAEIVGDSLLLLNRGNNLVIVVAWNQFVGFLNTGALPEVGYYTLDLPGYKGHRPRLSGAHKLNAKGDIVFSASIEKTENWHSDGEVLGSFIGVFHHGERRLKHFAVVTNKKGEILSEKIESVNVTALHQSNAHIVAVADDDKGHTTLMQIKMTW